MNRTELAKAADAAALAGAKELPGNPTQARSVATSYATSNSKAGDTISALTPDNNTLTVTISRNVSMLFAKVLGINSEAVSTHAKVEVGTAKSVPNIVPFVIPKPTALNGGNIDYDKVYVMRLFGGGDFLTTDINKGYVQASTGYPSGYTYPTLFTSTFPTYALSPVSSRYPYQFDYMNVDIAGGDDDDYIDWLLNGYSKNYSIDDTMEYRAPSTGSKQAVDQFAKRITNDHTGHTQLNAQVGDPRVMLIPIVPSMLPRNTSDHYDMDILGFAGFWLKAVHHEQGYTNSFWFEGYFLKDLNIGTGEITHEPTADFGLRMMKLTN
jgi:hypothetical protein